MSEPKTGSFCWVELGTSDLAGAKGFYAELFGWSFEEMPMESDPGHDGVYCMLQKGGEDVGGAYDLFPDQVANGIPPHWLPYVRVEDADEATEKAKSLGAMVVVEPLDVEDIGRMAVLVDPAGAAIAVWQAKARSGSAIYGDPDTPCWFELTTGDLAGAKRFYTELFGWKAQELDMGGSPYVMFLNGTERVGGMEAMAPEHGEAPPHWTVYFAVEDCDAAVGRIANGGGQVFVPPTDTPPGRFAAVADAAGASFSVIALNADYQG